MKHMRRSRGRVTTSLRAARKRKDFTQHSFAAVIGVSQQHYSKWERGEYLPGPDMRVRIASTLGTTVKALWPGLDRTAPAGRRARVIERLVTTADALGR